MIGGAGVGDSIAASDVGRIWGISGVAGCGGELTTGVAGAGVAGMGADVGEADDAASCISGIDVRGKLSECFTSLDDGVSTVVLRFAGRATDMGGEE